MLIFFIELDIQTYYVISWIELKNFSYIAKADKNSKSNKYFWYKPNKSFFQFKVAIWLNHIN